jgi:O-methyltransferase
MIFGRLKSAMEALRRANDPMNWKDRHGALYKAWGYVFGNQLQGDYYEFGVFDGRGLIRSFSVYQRYQRWLKDELQSSENWRREPAALMANYQSKFYGLDTFEGMPDNDEGSPFFSAKFFNCSIEEVTKRCAAVGLRGDSLCLMKGLFSESAPLLMASKPRPAAIVNLDCDLYVSAKDALAVCKHLIQDGTVLLCDDYNAFCANPNKGERRALTEFQQETNIQLEPWFPYQYNAQAFFCHRKP